MPEESPFPAHLIPDADALAHLLRLDKVEHSEYIMRAFALYGITLATSDPLPTPPSQGTTLVFQNGEGTIIPLPVGTHAQQPQLSAGFVIPGEKENLSAAKKRQQKQLVALQESTDLPLHLDFYTLNLLQHTVESITARTLQNLTRITDRQLDLLRFGLSQYGLSLHLEFIDDLVWIVFLDRHGAYCPLPFDQADWDRFYGVLKNKDTRKALTEFYGQPSVGPLMGGFIFAQDEHGTITTPHPNQSMDASKHYGDITGFQNMQMVSPFSEARMRNFIKTLDPERKDASKRKKTRLEEQKWIENVKSDLVSFLDPHLEAHGMRLIDAKQLIQPDSQEDASRLVFPSDVPFPLVDFLIVSTETSALELRYTTIMGWDKDPKNPDSPHSLFPYGNVCGLVVIPDSMPLSERKKLIRQAATQLARHFPTRPKSMILTVSPQLIEKWKNSQHTLPLVQPELTVETMVEKGISAKKAVDYGFYINRNTPPKVSVHTYEPNSTHIGGTQATVVIDRGDNLKNAILLDRGYIFDLVPTWSMLGAMPTYADGIKPFLRAGMFDIIRRLYRLDLLLNSISDDSIVMMQQRAKRNANGNTFQDLEEFLMLEVYHRLGEEAFVQFLRTRSPHLLQEMARRQTLTSFLAYHKQRESVLYAQKTIFDLAALTHAHQDHTLGIALLNPDIPVGWSSITRALCLADFRLASNWLAQDVAAVRERWKPKIGAAYPVQERAYRLFQDGERQEVSPGVFVTGIDVKHSIPGSMGFVVDVEHQGKRIARVAYPGDYKDGRFFTELGKMGGTDFLFIEGTNPPSAKKKSKSVTEEMVMERIDKDTQGANTRGDAIVVDTPKNAIERISNLLSIAQKNGRVLIFSPKILRRIRLLQVAVPSTPLLPEVHSGNPSIGVWKPKKGRYSSDEQDVFSVFGSTTYNMNHILNAPQHFLLVRESESPNKLEGLGKKVTWIDSTYGPYTEAARNEKRDRKILAKQHGWTLIADGRHASGHTPIVLRDDPWADESAPARLRDANAKVILPIHTERPGEVARVIEGFVDPNVTRVVKKRKHPRDTFEVR